MDQPFTIETWSRPQSGWPKKFNWAKITIWKVSKFFGDGESRWFPTISGLHADQGSPTKKFLLIESPRNQNRIVLRNMKLIWFGWWKMWVSKSNWRYGKIGWSMNSCFQQERISERSWLKREWVLIQLSTTKSIAGETGCAQPAEFSWWTLILLRHTGMTVSPELSDIPDSVVRLKSRRIWKSKFLQNGFGEKEKKERFECCDDLFPRLGIQIIL